MKKHKKRIYLAGPILGCSMGEARVWRNDVKKVFEPDCECLDPMVYSSSDDPAETIVRNDLELIRKSDIDAEIRQRASHNEFLGTGGSLYYLKDRDLVAGSMKVKIEVRDSVTGEV